MCNGIPHRIMDVIIYPCPVLDSVLVKGRGKGFHGRQSTVLSWNQLKSDCAKYVILSIYNQIYTCYICWTISIRTLVYMARWQVYRHISILYHSFLNALKKTVWHQTICLVYPEVQHLDPEEAQFYLHDVGRSIMKCWFCMPVFNL